MSKINNDWKEILEEEFEKEYFIKLKETLEEEYKNYIKQFDDLITRRREDEQSKK